MKTTSLFFLIILSICNSFAQNGVKNFFPLNIGNKYIYFKEWTYFPGGHGTSFEISTITNDTIAYGKKYYWAINFPIFDKQWIRLDSITGSLYKLNKSNTCSFYDHELIIDSLWAGLNDSTKNCLSPFSCLRCTDTSYIYKFGELRQKKFFMINCSSPPVYNCSSNRTYLESIGIYASSSSSSGGGGFGGGSWELRGCIINGIVMGDTSIIGITNFSSEVPTEIELFQNYPNPFNPVTNIEFDIPERSFVKLIIYDVLGSEIETLVSEELSPGKYNTSWGAVRYSSGVYYYKLVTDKFTETKKMLLIK